MAENEQFDPQFARIVPGHTKNWIGAPAERPGGQGLRMGLRAMIGRICPLPRPSSSAPRVPPSAAMGVLSEPSIRLTWRRRPRGRRSSGQASTARRVSEVLMGHAPPGGIGSEHRSSGRRAGRTARKCARLHHQQSLRVEPASRRVGRAVDPHRRVRGRRRRWDGVDEPHAVSHRRGRRALGAPDGALHARRCDVSRRVHLLVVRSHHGRDGRNTRPRSTASRARRRMPTRSRRSAAPVRRSPPAGSMTRSRRSR